MATSIDTFLKTLSLSYYLKNESAEIQKIDKSINALFANMDRELGQKIKRRFIFGSYDRDTILPRRIDEKSDVDVMIVFKHTEYERLPDTYRGWLKTFADKCYKERYDSEVVQSSPSVVVRLGNIHYDLVPAKEEGGLFYPATLYIPAKTSGWQQTDPNDVKSKLTVANTRYSNIVRPIIRLMKAWNCTNGYPYESYGLELWITGQSFYGMNVQSGFFQVVDMLTPNWYDPQWIQGKIASLKMNINNAKACLQRDETDKAKHWISRVMP